MYKIIMSLLLVLFASPSYAALAFLIDNYTTDELSFTISGTFDADSIGTTPGYLAIKNDWSNNGGVHTELFSSTPTITLNTIAIGGSAPDTYILNSGESWRDSILFSNPLGTYTAILAGTSVSGSMTLSAMGAFNPADASTLELLSGYSVPFASGLGNDWTRLEASAQTSPVPLPASIWFLGAGLAGFFRVMRRQSVSAVAA